MQDWLASHYLWLKAFHVISVMAWMAGMLYLPRLFVYHAEKAPPGSELSELYKTMEIRLFRQIMNPAMISAWIFGGLMLVALGLDTIASLPWLHAKLALVVAMTWFHHWLGLRRKDFAADRNTRSGRTYRFLNEVPALIMVGIVILAVAEPF